MERILFIDRDGTLIEEPSDFQIDSVEKFNLLKGTIPALLKLQSQGYRLVMVTNQDGLGSDRYPQARFDQIQKLLMGILETQGIHFEKILICPHFEKDGCECRKPRLGMVMEYLSNPSWDRSHSYVIGDRQTDLTLAERMGVRGILMGTWDQALKTILESDRQASVQRKTKETDIQVKVDLDGKGKSSISTGIGFFDHMLEQLSKHGGFELNIQVQGDLHIDEHHTVEDTALALGAALSKALGNKAGIGRYGFWLPMDEASAEATIDLSGRPYFVLEGKYDRDSVGGFPTELVTHFFRSLAESLGAALHLRVKGENTHHMVESSFKAVARALRAAFLRTGVDEGVPSTKGIL